MTLFNRTRRTTTGTTPIGLSLLALGAVLGLVLWIMTGRPNSAKNRVPGSSIDTARSVATALAHKIADSARPASTAAPASVKGEEAWPENVSAVSYVATTRARAAVFIDGKVGAPDDRPVVVVRLIGTFSEATTGLPGTPTRVSGTVLTAVADVATSEVLDSGLRKGTPEQLPDGIEIYNGK